MARKSKIDTHKQTNGQRSESGSRGVGDGAAEEPKATGTVLKSKGKKAAPRKKIDHRPVAAHEVPRRASSYEPSDEEIRIRAYFIAERRMQLALQGDSDHDWIEARRQLVEEASRSAL